MKYFLAAAFLVFVLTVSSVYAVSDSLQVSASSNFGSTDNFFTPGQTVYVKVVTDNAGGSEKILRLKDNVYKDLQSFQFNRSGSGPYTYTASFAAPSTQNVYSLEASIKDGSNNSLLVQTFQIESSQSSSSNVSTKINVNVSTGGNGVSNKGSETTSQPTPTPTETPKATNEAEIATDSASSVTFNPPAEEQKEKRSIVERFFSGIFNAIKNVFNSIF